MSSTFEPPMHIRRLLIDDMSCCAATCVVQYRYIGVLVTPIMVLINIFSFQDNLGVWPAERWKRRRRAEPFPLQVGVLPYIRALLLGHQGRLKRSESFKCISQSRLPGEPPTGNKKNESCHRFLSYFCFLHTFSFLHMCVVGNCTLI